MPLEHGRHNGSLRVYLKEPTGGLSGFPIKQMPPNVGENAAAKPNDDMANVYTVWTGDIFSHKTLHTFATSAALRV